MRYFALASAVLAFSLFNFALAQDEVLVDETPAQPDPIPVSSHSLVDDFVGGCRCDDCKPLFRLKTRVFLENVWSSDYAGAVPQPLERTRFSADDTRLGFEGWLRGNLFYRAEMGFVRDEVTYPTYIDDVELGDVYLELTDSPVGNVRVGHFIEPLSMERQSRKELLPLMERSVATRNFSPARNLGVMVYDHLPWNENLSWYVGTFMGNKRDDFHASSSDWAATGRVAWLLHYDECCHRLWHVGFGASARRTGNTPAVDGNGRWRGHVPLGDLRSLIATTLIPDTEFNVYNMEIAWARGPLSAQAEAYYAEANTGNRLYMSGVYAQVSLFLTGEHREYDRTMKTFSRVYPLDPVFGGGQRGHGALELVARYGYNDLNDVKALFPGNSVPPTVIGDQSDFTFGANWYLSANTRVMFNYVHSNVFYEFIGSSDADHCGVRFAWDY